MYTATTFTTNDPYRPILLVLPLRETLYCPGANDTRKRPSLSVVNDAISPFWVSTAKAVFASGETGESARTGPGRAGLSVTTPSIPVSEPDRVWPGKKPAHMIRTARAIESLRNCI